MGSLKSYVALAGILAIAASTTARAADLLPPPPLPLPPVEEIGGAWYLRGDVGVGILQTGRVTGLTTPALPGNNDYATLRKSIDDQVFVGAGVGYQFNDWLRVDATGEYRTKAGWHYTEQYTNPLPNGAAGFDFISGNISSAVGLANVYFDLFHAYGATLFVGGGIGVAHNMFANVQDVGGGAFVGGYGYARPRDTTNLAWALHAGIGYDVSPNLKLELAYRYLNMGDVRTGGVVCLPDCATSTVYRVRSLESHDIKIGMRWMLGGPVAAPEPEPIPLIRKY